MSNEVLTLNLVSVSQLSAINSNLQSILEATLLSRKFVGRKILYLPIIVTFCE